MSCRRPAGWGLLAEGLRLRGGLREVPNTAEDIVDTAAVGQPGARIAGGARRIEYAGIVIRVYAGFGQCRFRCQNLAPGVAQCGLSSTLTAATLRSAEFRRGPRQNVPGVQRHRSGSFVPNPLDRAEFLRYPPGVCSTETAPMLAMPGRRASIRGNCAWQWPPRSCWPIPVARNQLAIRATSSWAWHRSSARPRYTR